MGAQSSVTMIVGYIVLIIGLTSAAAIDAVEVTTNLGAIRGTILKSRLGKDFYAFRGIRYANSPVNQFRFKQAQAVSPWKPKVFDATEDGPMCPQSPFNSTDYSEDCLRLNVYSRNLDTKALKPVIIYLHPGGFYAASGDSKNFAGPQLIMDRDDIVFVTINFRLGTLGFLALGTSDAPGNAGLKDQVLAMKWVKAHILKFGGDPNSVTLVGYSAGSFSIGLHMASPMSKGLFHRGITMSASPVFQYKYPKNQIELAKRQAELVNCPTNSINAMIQCLKKTPADEFVRTHTALFDFGVSPVLNWMPVIEKELGQERFIIEEPLDSFQTGNFQRIPLIVGMTKDEFVGIGHDVMANETMLQQMNEDWDRLAPICLLYERNTPRSKEISAVLKKEYLNNKPLKSGDSFEPLGKLFSDGLVGFAVHRFAHLAARCVPVHYYKFSYKGRYSYFNYPKNTPYGTSHHDDLIYLLHIPVLAPLLKKTDPEDTTIERMTRMWTQFAKTGNPNNPKDEYLKNLNWTPLRLKDGNYLDIGNEMVMKNNLFLERFKIWQNLFPLKWNDKPCNRGRNQSRDYPEPLDD